MEERDLNDATNDASATNTGTSMEMMTDKNAGTIYDDYKLLTHTEIEQFNIEHLIGTPLLRGYMHGFFIEIGFYNRIRAVANLFEYEEYRKNKIRQKMNDKRASLIAPKTKSKNNKNNKNNKTSSDPNKTKVNSDLAQRLSSNTKDTKVAKSILGDDRFGSLFTNPDFQIDQDDINFKLRNPSGVKHQKRKDEDIDSDANDDDDNENDSTNADDNNTNMDGFQRVNANDGWNNSDKDDDNSYDSEEDDDEEDGIRGGLIEVDRYVEKCMNK